jgi:tetratricopeptide (TPR) repeat protein
MAGVPLADTQSCSDFFRRRILLNLHYWHDNPAVQTTDVAVLDQEWTGLIRAINFAFEIEQAWSLTRTLIAALSPYMERRGYWETWHRILDQAVDTAGRAGDLAGAVDLSLLLARLLQRESRLKEASAYYRQTIRLARRVGDENSEARACSNLGYLYIEQGHWHRAEVLCCHALTIFERIDSDHGRAHTENHLGILYTRQRCWEPARQHLEQACAIWQSMGDDHGLMRGHINFGMLYVDSECPNDALFYLEKALHQANLTGEEIEIATIHLNMGIAYRLKGESAQAEAHAWQAEAIFNRFSNLMGLANVWDNLGLACLDQEKWKEAKLYLEAALQAWRKLPNQFGEIRTLTYLVEYQLAVGNHSKAVRQLAKVKDLIRQYDPNDQDPRCQALLEKYYHLGEEAIGEITKPLLLSD